MKYCKLPVFALLFLGVIFSVTGEVFTLWPYSGGKSVSGSKWPLLQEGSGVPLFTEKITVNGFPFELKAYRLTWNREDLLTFIKRNFRPEQRIVGQDFIRLSNRLPSGNIERFLLMFSPESGTWTLFRSEVPEKIPKITEWSPDLPELPEGAVPDQMILFPERDAVCGSFRDGPENPEFTLSGMAEKLKRNGFLPLSGEYKKNGTGEIFFRKNPKTLLWVNFSPDGSGVFYQKKIK